MFRRTWKDWRRDADEVVAGNRLLIGKDREPIVPGYMHFPNGLCAAVILDDYQKYVTRDSRDRNHSE